MRYTTEVSLALPRSRVIELFDNMDNMVHRQPGLKSFMVISGVPGQDGCHSELIFEGRNGKLGMTETITKRNLPDEFHVNYKVRGFSNQLFHYFSETNKGHTLWRTENVFRFRGLMALMAPFMKTAFKNNTLLSMERFKTFAETSNHQ